MVVYVNDKEGNTHRFDATSIVADGKFRVVESSSGIVEFSVPNLKPTTELVEMNFCIAQQANYASLP